MTKKEQIEEMAKAIMNSGDDYCSKYCFVSKACNERLQGDETALPPEDYCIKQIIRFFENEANQEQNKG